MAAAIGAEHDKNAVLDPGEDKYVHARLGDEGYAKLQEKLKNKELTYAAVRERLYGEMKGYSNGALTNKGAYDPDQTNAGLKTLVAAPAGPAKPTPEDLKMSDALGRALYSAFDQLVPANKDAFGNSQAIKESKLLYAYLQGHPEDAQKMLAALSDPNKKTEAAALLEKYRKDALAAARTQILTPAAQSPFGNNQEAELLDAYCDAMRPAGGPAPAKACAPAPGDKPEMQKLEMAACAADGRSFDGNKNAAPADPDKINAKCGETWAKHDKARAHPNQNRQVPNDGMAGIDSGTTPAPTANKLGDCQGGPDKCASPKKPGPNDKLPWETGVAWAAVAMIALGILTGGIGLAVVAGAAAAGLVGWYIGNEANR